MGGRVRLFFRAWRELVSGEYALQFTFAETVFGRIYAAVFLTFAGVPFGGRRVGYSLREQV